VGGLFEVKSFGIEGHEPGSVHEKLLALGSQLVQFLHTADLYLNPNLRVESSSHVVLFATEQPQ
jgi:hypothetical protein